MRQVRIIKKNEVSREVKQSQTIGIPSADSRLGDAVKRWVADWRARKEIEKQRALGELSGLKKNDAVAAT
jgi:hypothetical protein